MPRRRTIHIDPVRHGAPIPMAAMVDNVLMTSAIHGADPATGEMAEGADAQAQFAFDNLGRILEVAGGSLDDVVFVKVFLKDPAFRDAVNRPWLALFPDENDRPARHTVEANLPPGALVQLEVVAVIGV